jgi:hypothetical protein
MDATGRFELHERWPGDKPDYHSLYSSLDAAGWSRFVWIGASLEELPSGTYRHAGGNSMDILMATAKAAVAKTGHTASIYISRGDEVATWGLRKLNAIAPPSLAPTWPSAFSPAPASKPLPGLTHPTFLESVLGLTSTKESKPAPFDLISAIASCNTTPAPMGLVDAMIALSGSKPK